MRIRSIELANFRSYTRATLTLGERLTCVWGPNGAGKSTTIASILFGLIGRCEGLEGSDRTAYAELIRTNEREGGVRLDVDGVGKVERTSDGDKLFFKVADWTGSVKQQQSALLEYLETTEPVLMACLDSESFLRLHHADAKALIMGVLNVRISAEQLAPLHISGPIGLEERERLYKIHFDNRTIAKRSLDEAVIAPMPDGDEPPAIEQLQAALEDVRLEEKALLEAGAEARGAVKQLEQERGRLTTEQAEVTRKITALRDPHAALDKYEAELVAHRAAKTADVVQQAATPAEEPPIDLDTFDGVDAERQEVETLRVTLADSRGRLKMLEPLVADLKAHDPKRGCVIAATVPCATAAKEFTGKVRALGTEIKDLQQGIAEADGRLRWLTAQEQGRQQAKDRADALARRQALGVVSAVAQAEIRAEAWRGQERAIEQKISAAKAQIHDLQVLEERRREIGQRLASIGTEIDNYGDVTLPAEIADIRARISRGEQIIAHARVWLEAKQRHDADMARTQHLRDEVAKLETLVQALGPKGLIVDAIEAARYRFEERVNRALAKWGYHLEFQIEPWTIRVNGKKSTQLSKSQKLRVGIALQLAIAEITGLRFVAIDQADALDARERGILQDVISGWEGQILLCATKDPGFELPASIPEGMAFYLVELREDATTAVQAAA